MAELHCHPHDQIHARIRWGAFTELRTAVHGRVPRGFCSHLSIVLSYNLQFKELILFFPGESSIPSTSFWVIKIILGAEIISI